MRREEPKCRIANKQPPGLKAACAQVLESTLGLRNLKECGGFKGPQRCVDAHKAASKPKAPKAGEDSVAGSEESRALSNAAT